MATGDVILARMTSTFDGEPIINSLAFVDVGSGESTFPGVAVALATEMVDVFGLGGAGGALLGGLSVQFVMNMINLVDVVPGTDPMYSFPIGQAGDITDDDAMPPNDALCVTWRSSFKGPSGRGRTYLTGFAEGAANGGYWLSATQDYAQGVAIAMLARWGETGTGNFRFVVLHRVAGGVPIVPPEQKPVMSYAIHNEVRSIGRRAVGRRIRRNRTGP
jgi:hypothetical protein